jgi:hypothetical protein
LRIVDNFVSPYIAMTYADVRRRRNYLVYKELRNPLLRKDLENILRIAWILRGNSVV